MKLSRIWLILSGIFIIANLAWLDYRVFLISRFSDEEPLSTSEISSWTDDPELFFSEDFSYSGKEPVPFSETSCAECLELISNEVQKAVATFSAVQREIVGETALKETEEKAAQPASPPQTVYLPLGSGGSTTATDWQDVGGSNFVFDLAEWGNKTRVYWQGNQRAEHANSRCYARIYDATNYRAVDFSEQTTDQTTYQILTSLALSIWQGKNDYQLQMKSLNGTACFLESPRLIIVSQ
ncbi:MAG: hypothetical protein JW991_02440 [Candidatus Pacebacteria bacterium]|nr:hypothetical protein [Candidatus Paceibacterota bacterium]